jgi:HK97 family phage major capsid protein
MIENPLTEPLYAKFSATRSLLDELLKNRSAPKFSLARVLLNTLEKRNQDDSDAAIMKVVCADLERSGVHVLTPMSSMFAPWSALAARALSSSAPGSSGGYMVMVDGRGAIDVLRPWSVTARAGITVLDNLTGNVVFPRTVTKATGTWQGAQGTSVSAADTALGAISLTPHTAIGIVDISLQLLRQSAADAYLQRELLRTVGSAIDAAVLTGTGGSQPLGIANTPSVGTQSGATLGQAGVVHMKAVCATQNARDEGIAFVSTPAVREILEQRDATTLSGIYVWRGDKVADRPAHVTTDCPSATMFCGDFGDVLLGMWGSGFQFDVNGSGTNFNTGKVSVRVMAHVDVAVMHPSSWCISTSIT